MPFTHYDGGGPAPSGSTLATGAALTAGQIQNAKYEAIQTEFLNRLGRCAFYREMQYILAWRKVAANAAWGDVRYADETEMQQWQDEFLKLPWCDGSRGVIPWEHLPNVNDTTKACAAYSMRAYLVASRLAAFDSLAFFDRSDYNFFYATSIGLPAPIGLPRNSEYFIAAQADNYARGYLRCRWTVSGNVWSCILRGDSFGLPDSVIIDWSAARLATPDAPLSLFTPLPGSPDGK